MNALIIGLMLFAVFATAMGFVNLWAERGNYPALWAVAVVVILLWVSILINVAHADTFFHEQDKQKHIVVMSAAMMACDNITKNQHVLLCGAGLFGAEVLRQRFKKVHDYPDLKADALGVVIGYTFKY